MILAGAFGLDTGPVEMFQIKSPSLAFLVQENLETGQAFRPTGGWN